MEEAKVYKVVRVLEKDGETHYQSAWVENIELIEEYALGKETVPQIGRVFVFSNPNDARTWAHTQLITNDRTKKWAVLTYLAKGIVPAPRFIPIVKVCDIYSLEIFWETDALMPEDAYNVQRAPDGTLLAESVTPIEVYVDLSDNQYNWEA
jgi:hypothetical protein